MALYVGNEEISQKILFNGNFVGTPLPDVSSETAGQYLSNDGSTIKWEDVININADNTFSGNNNFLGNNTYSGNNTFTNDNTFSGNNTFSGDNNFSGNNTFSGDNNFLGNNTYSGNNTFTNDNTFSGNNTFSGDNNFSGNNTFSGDNNFSGNNTYTGKNTFTNIEASTKESNDVSSAVATTEWVKNNNNLLKTNCITEIPQDIKLELNDGTLTLKAGSKVYVPNGFKSDGKTPKFDVRTTNEDLSVTGSGTGSSIQIITLTSSFSLRKWDTNNLFSGATAPTSVKYPMWYDTTNNVIKISSDYGQNWSGTDSFPICIYTLTNGVITSIGQVFNGFGYIGSTAFALPGVKGLIPNGRNEDGSLKNIEFTTSSVITSTFSGTANRTILVLSRAWIGESIKYSYDSDLNYVIYGGDKTNKQTVVMFGYCGLTSGVITSLTPKTAFHAVDYNDYAREVDNTVHKTGNETIAGIKTFSQGDIRGRTSTSSSLGVARYACFDKDGKQFSDAWITRSEGGNSNGVSWAGFRISDSEGMVTADRSLAIWKLPDSDTIMTDAPTPPASDNSTQIATTNWCYDPAKSTNLVHRTGNEIISGSKTFASASNGIAIATKSQVINSDVTPSSIQFSNYIDGYDINGKLLSRIYTYKLPNGNNGIGLQAWKDSTVSGITVDSTGTTFAPTPPASDNSTKIATTAWVHNNKATIVGWGMPNYDASISISQDQLVAGYTAPKNGILNFSGWTGSEVTTTLTRINGQTLFICKQAGNINSSSQVILALNEGEKITISQKYSYQFNGGFFAPFKGVN